MSRIVILWLAIALFATPFNAKAQSRRDSPEVTQARTLLVSRGLMPVGQVWITRREANLRRLTESLERLERIHQLAVTKAEQTLAANETIRARLAQSEAAERAKNGKPAPPTRDSASGSIAPNAVTPPSPPTKLVSTLPDVTGLGEQTPLQQAMIELVEARAAVQLAILRIQADAAALPASYVDLKQDTAVKSALSSLGNSARLGPAKTYDREVQRAAALTESAFKPSVVGYFESNRFRLPAILNESQPVTFSFRTDNTPLILTANAAQQLGVSTESPSKRKQEIAIGDKRVAATPVMLQSLRIGSIVLKNREVLVLPPEAEDWGSSLSAAALPGYQTLLQPTRMLLTLAPPAIPKSK